MQKKKARIFLPFVFSFIPGLLYYFNNPTILGFLDIGFGEFVIVNAFFLFPFLFMVFYSKVFNLNKWFWFGFASIFIINFYIIFPDVYIYGYGNREDLKFFIKALQYDFFECTLEVFRGVFVFMGR